MLYNKFKANLLPNTIIIYGRGQRFLNWMKLSWILEWVIFLSTAFIFPSVITLIPILLFLQILSAVVSAIDILTIEQNGSITLKRWKKLFGVIFKVKQYYLTEISFTILHLTIKSKKRTVLIIQNSNMSFAFKGYTTSIMENKKRLEEIGKVTEKYRDWY